MSCSHTRLLKNMPLVSSPHTMKWAFQLIPTAFSGEPEGLGCLVAPFSDPMREHGWVGRLGVWTAVEGALLFTPASGGIVLIREMLETALWIPASPSSSKSHTQGSQIMWYLCNLECSGWVAVSWMVYGCSNPSSLHLRGGWTLSVVCWEVTPWD